MTQTEQYLRLLASMPALEPVPGAYWAYHNMTTGLQGPPGIELVHFRKEVWTAMKAKYSTHVELELYIGRRVTPELFRLLYAHKLVDERGIALLSKNRPDLAAFYGNHPNFKMPWD